MYLITTINNMRNADICIKHNNRIFFGEKADKKCEIIYTVS